MEEVKSLEQLVFTKVVSLNAKVHGVVTGLVFGLGIFVATNWLVLKGGNPVGPHLSLLGQYFIGYTVSFAGSFIGLGYGLLTGFIAGYSVAIIYNRLVEFRKPKYKK